MPTSRPPRRPGFPRQLVELATAGRLFLAVVLAALVALDLRLGLRRRPEDLSVLDAFDMARPCKPGSLIHHSDRGTQYISIAFGNRCKQAGARPSRGPLGGVYNDAMCEGFLAALECEPLDRPRFHSPTFSDHMRRPGGVSRRRRHRRLGAGLDGSRRANPSWRQRSGARRSRRTIAAALGGAPTKRRRRARSAPPSGRDRRRRTWLIWSAAAAGDPAPPAIAHRVVAGILWAARVRVARMDRPPLTEHPLAQVQIPRST